MAKAKPKTTDKKYYVPSIDAYLKLRERLDESFAAQVHSYCESTMKRLQRLTDGRITLIHEHATDSVEFHWNGENMWEFVDAATDVKHYGSGRDANKMRETFMRKQFPGLVEMLVLLLKCNGCCDESIGEITPSTKPRKYRTEADQAWMDLQGGN